MHYSCADAQVLSLSFLITKWRKIIRGRAELLRDG